MKKIVITIASICLSLLAAHLGHAAAYLTIDDPNQAAGKEGASSQWVALLSYSSPMYPSHSTVGGTQSASAGSFQASSVGEPRAGFVSAGKLLADGMVGPKTWSTMRLVVTDYVRGEGEVVAYEIVFEKVMLTQYQISASGSDVGSGSEDFTLSFQAAR